MKYTERVFDFNNIFENKLLELDVGNIYQVAELSVIRGGQITQHMQRCDEITYVVSGSAEIISNDNKSEIRQGQIHYIKNGCTHQIQAAPDKNFRYVCIGFFPNLNNSSVKAFYEKCGNRDFFIADDNGMVKNIAEFLIREFYNYDEHSNRMIDQYISQMLTALTRILSGNDYVYNINHGKESGNYTMYKMLKYIDREYMQIQSVREIASQLSYSECYLSHLFKEKMGITIKEYINKKKIMYAAELLVTSNSTIEQLSEQFGFSRPFTFRRAFKQYIGMTPSEYRNTPPQVCDKA